jgi:hypothetical protein
MIQRILLRDFLMSSRKATLFVKSAMALAFLSFTTPVFATTTSQPIPSGSQLSCQQAINRTTGWLVEKKAFIPFTTNTRPGRIQPRVAIENGNYAEIYRTFPSNRPEKIVFYLSGEENQIWQGVLGSPQTLTTFAALMMASCPSVGLVEYRHWWEGYQPVGYFPDNTAKAFIWVDHNDPRRYRWGYFYTT